MPNLKLEASITERMLVIYHLQPFYPTSIIFANKETKDKRGTVIPLVVSLSFICSFSDYLMNTCGEQGAMLNRRQRQICY